MLRASNWRVDGSNPLRFNLEQVAHPQLCGTVGGGQEETVSVIVPPRGTQHAIDLASSRELIELNFNLIYQRASAGDLHARNYRARFTLLNITYYYQSYSAD